jgi:hypothetical protein
MNQGHTIYNTWRGASSGTLKWTHAPSTAMLITSHTSNGRPSFQEHAYSRDREEENREEHGIHHFNVCKC